MKKTKNAFMLLMLLFAAVSFTACGGDDDDNGGSSGDNTSGGTGGNTPTELEQKLFGTSWRLYYVEYSNGKEDNNHTGYGSTLSFSQEKDNSFYKLYVDGEHVGGWRDWATGTSSLVKENGTLYLSYYKVSASRQGAYGVTFGSSPKITRLTDTELQWEFLGKNVYFTRVSDSSFDDSGSSSSSGEKPEIGFYDFTATQTSLKVQYRIYNNSASKVTSAKIYYGTSSNPTSSKTASVAGTMITASLSGLKKGTTYYVKCQATNANGTTTTSTTKCITNY